jgi:rhodanese-related sulfurtransferase
MNKHWPDIKTVALIVITAAITGLVFNRLAPNSIPFIRQEKQYKWADDTAARPSETVAPTSSNKNNNNEGVADQSVASVNDKAFSKSTGTKLKSAQPPATEETKHAEQSKIKDKAAQLITVRQANAFFTGGKAVFIDARDKWEFSEGHIKGALNVPEYIFEKSKSSLEKLPRSKPAVVYCGGDDCDMSIRLAEKMKEMGFSAIYIFKAGWDEWNRQNLPSEKSELK